MPVSSTFTPAAVAALGGPAWLRAVRSSALDRFQALAALPTEAEEIWRYTRISELDLDAYGPVPAAPSDPALPPELDDLLAAIGPRAALAATRNGQLVTTEGEGRFTVGTMTGSAAEDEVLGTIAHDPDAFAVLNMAFAADPLLVQVPAGVAVHDPIVIVHWIDTDGVGVFPRTVVRVGEAAEVTVVEIVASRDVAAFVAPVTELQVSRTANLRYVTIQDLGPRVWQVAYQGSEVAQEATLLSSTVAIGGDYARQRTDSRLVGPGSTGNLVAVYFGDGGQMHDFRTLQDHRAPKSTSDLLFKGAVAGNAHAVYSGLIRVEKGARGTNAFQTNRNLVLADGARADSVPNLEIEENEVRCSHASAVGPIDLEQRYYLESRGIPTEVASRLIVVGFLAEVLERLPVVGLRQHLRDALAFKLDHAETNLLADA
ncbi:MAG: Fe-S cluster assembly protein SufD [Acidimicrobiaceae bacterium]|nr:Fe-S cluster assembly protein SufD [Acidimicrobiaceae bacterium]